ncbi:hypothetical protein C2U72_00355 [Prosthecomicrobium hirschii]|nr:hypothetical protein C2U72_00355 [Prosthecomicrobium hirschii]
MAVATAHPRLAIIALRASDTLFACAGVRNSGAALPVWRAVKALRASLEAFSTAPHRPASFHSA